MINRCFLKLVIRFLLAFCLRCSTPVGCLFGYLFGGSGRKPETHHLIGTPRRVSSLEKSRKGRASSDPESNPPPKSYAEEVDSSP